MVIDLGDPIWSKEESFVGLLECKHTKETFLSSVTKILGENWKEEGWLILKNRTGRAGAGPTEHLFLSFQAYIKALKHSTSTTE